MGDRRTRESFWHRVSARVSLLLLLSYAGQVCAAATDSHEPKPNDRSGRGCRDALQALGCGACQVNSVSRVNAEGRQASAAATVPWTGTAGAGVCSAVHSILDCLNAGGSLSSADMV